MSTKTHLQLWSDFLAYMEERCSHSEFHNWLAPIQALESRGDDLILQVPNIFVQEYLLQNYKNDLLGFVPVRSNGELALQFVVSEETKKSPAPVQTSPTEVPSLNPLYTFDNFIEGPSNQFVKSAALGVATHPGKSYNPLFIHGGPGLGKTHLLHAIGHAIAKKDPRLKISCITTEGFMNEIVANLEKKSMDKMKKRYRSSDVLLVDDIQFLRPNFEEEFCNTFESLVQQQKQIVIISDKPPSQLKLSDRMIARMEWGLVAHVGIPDLETRAAILQHKAELKGIRLPHQMTLFIAGHIFQNVRQLEGAINRLFAFSRLIQKELTQEIVEKTLGELLQQEPQKRLSVDTILQCIATIFDVPITALKGKSRTPKIAFPRQVAMYLAKELMTDSLEKLASAFGGKTHSTLHYAWDKIRDQLQKDDTLRKQVEMAKRDLGNGKDSS